MRLSLILRCQRICALAAIICGVVLSLACHGALATESKQVMLLHSFGRDFKPWSEYARIIRMELNQQSSWPLDITEHSLVTARSPDEDPEVPFVEYLRALFAKRSPDIIVSIGAPAAAFVQRHRQQLFATTPMVFTAVDQRRVQYSSLTANDAVVALRINYLAAMENILQVLPNTKDVMVVVGTSPIERFWKDAIAKEAAPLANRIRVSWTDELSFEELLRQASALPPQTAIFWELMIVDAAGVVHEGGTPLTRLHAVANAPIFSYDESFFGNEIVGGPLLLTADSGRQTAAVAIRILSGEKPSEIKVPVVQFASPIFDWRQMQRWGIRESRLPLGSKIYFRDPTLWEQYQWQIVLIVSVILVQAALIVGLLYEHRRRQVAEAESLHRVNELAQMNRFATAGALSASIAHEVRQPLTTISAAGETALIWLKRRVPNLKQARKELESVIKASHRADDVLNSVRAMFNHEPTARTKVNLDNLVQQVIALAKGPIDSNNIVVETNLTAGVPAIVMADPVQLQQVILNLIVNAVEAMSHSDETRVLQVRTEPGPAKTVVVSVVDSGPRVDPEVVNKMFQPFFTTKSSGMGMGLSICKTIVEAHGGQLTASPNNPHGMEFRITLSLHQQT
jgi:signal transduction histidine kinase